MMNDIDDDDDDDSDQGPCDVLSQSQSHGCPLLPLSLLPFLPFG